MERRRAAILAADLVGYSRMMAQDEAGVLARLMAWRRDVLTPAVAAGGGRVFKTTGDGALAIFPDAAQAVTAALDMQGRTTGAEFSFRVGVNLGEVMLEGDDVFGDEVNVAARLEGMAAPGGVLISDEAQGAAGADGFHDNGLRKFRNIERPIRVWSWPEKLPSLRAATLPRLHVAPFEGAAEAERALAADLTAEILARAARLTGLEPVTSDRTAHYRLSGSARLAAGRCRLFLRLDAVDEERQVWADRLDYATDDPFDIVDAASPRIVMGARRRIAADDGMRLARRPLDELSLTDLMALAGVTFFTPTREAWRRGGDIAEQALAVDGSAFMALAMAAASRGFESAAYGLEAPDVPAMRLARRRVEAALSINNRSDMAHVTRAGLLLFGDGALDEAEAAARRALEINPDYNMAWWMLSEIGRCAGRFDEAAEQAETAVRINPDDPYLHFYSRAAGWAHFGAGRFAAALDWFRRADQLAPGVAPHMLGVIVAAEAAGDRAEASRLVRRLLEAAPDLTVGAIHPPPFRDPANWVRIAAAARAAGLPE